MRLKSEKKKKEERFIQDQLGTRQVYAKLHFTRPGLAWSLLLIISITIALCLALVDDRKETLHYPLII